MSDLDFLREYLSQSVRPLISEFLHEDEYIIVLGGSHSFGMADEHSDYDLFILWDVEPSVWGPKLGEILGKPHKEKGLELQIVPIHISRNPLYAALFKGEMETLWEAPVTDLFHIAHYIPLHDTKDRISQAQISIRYHNNDEYWAKQCHRAACEAIEALEAFYDASKRKDEMTMVMFFGAAVQKLLELFILGSRRFYPPKKWLWKMVEEIDSNLFATYHYVLSLDTMPLYLKSLTERTVELLFKNNMIKPFVAADLLNP